MTEKYNGWSSYETWLVKVWIDNDEGKYNHWMRVARSADVANLADALKDAHTDEMPETTGVYADLMTAGLFRVNWTEIAEHLKEEA